MRLTINSGGAAGTSFEPSERFVLGRDDGCDLVVDDEEVSREHVAFSPSSGGLMVEDLGSRNGTFVNGERLSAPMELTGGEQIVIGKTTIDAESPPRAPETAVAAAPADAGVTQVAPTPEPPASAPPPAAPPPVTPAPAAEAPPPPPAFAAPPPPAPSKASGWGRAGAAVLALVIAFGAAVLIVVTVNTVSTPLCLDSAQVGLPPPQGQELRDGKCIKQSSAYRAFFAVLAGVAAAAASLAALLALAVTVTGRGWRRCLICLGIAVVLSIPLFTLKLKAIDYGPVIQGFQPTAPVQ